MGRDKRRGNSIRGEMKEEKREFEHYEGVIWNGRKARPGESRHKEKNIEEWQEIKNTLPRNRGTY